MPPGYRLTKKKPFYKRVWFWLLAAVAVIVVLVIAAIASAVNDAVSSKHTVVYKVTGTGTGDITYYTWDAARNTDNSITGNATRLPWTHTVQLHGSLSSATVSATPSDIMKRTTLCCSLSVDGKVVSTDTGNSALVICSN